MNSREKARNDLKDATQNVSQEKRGREKDSSKKNAEPEKGSLGKEWQLLGLRMASHEEIPAMKIEEEGEGLDSQSAKMKQTDIMHYLKPKKQVHIDSKEPNVKAEPMKKDEQKEGLENSK